MTKWSENDYEHVFIYSTYRGSGRRREVDKALADEFRAGSCLVPCENTIV